MRHPVSPPPQFRIAGHGSCRAYGARVCCKSYTQPCRAGLTFSFGRPYRASVTGGICSVSSNSHADAFALIWCSPNAARLRPCRDTKHEFFQQPVMLVEIYLHRRDRSMTTLSSRFKFASAPDSWGVLDYPGPSWEQSYQTMLDEMVVAVATRVPSSDPMVSCPRIRSCLRAN